MSTKEAVIDFAKRCEACDDDRSGVPRLVLGVEDCLSGLQDRDAGDVVPLGRAAVKPAVVDSSDNGDNRAGRQKRSHARTAPI